MSQTSFDPFFTVNLFIIKLKNKKNSMNAILSMSTLMAKILAIMIPLLLAVAFLKIGMRKVMASMQRRKGPHGIGVFGTVNRVKIIFNEIMRHHRANVGIFLFFSILLLITLLLFDEEVNLIKVSMEIALVNYIASLSLYILTKRYNRLFPLIPTFFNFILSIYIFLRPCSINEDFFVFGVNCGNVGFN